MSDDWKIGAVASESSEKLSDLRDRFAAAAIGEMFRCLTGPGRNRDSDFNFARELAAACYDIADAMLEERSKR